MTGIRFILIAVALVAAAALASTAPAARSAFANCGKLAGGGNTYVVIAAGLRCGTARTIVHTLLRKRLPSGLLVRYPGTYGGLHCIRAKGHGLIHIQCTSTDGRKSLFATARTP